MIYGAYGFTGKLISHLAVSEGLKPILSGRNPEKVERLANELGLDYVFFDLKNEEIIEKALRGVYAVLNVAGPFSSTAEKMVEACLKTGTHYLDITGEISVLEKLASKDERAKSVGIAIIPAVGFDVVTTDCLASKLHELLPDANKLELAFRLKDPQMSRGTIKSLLEGMSQGIKVRKNGRIIAIHSFSREIVFGDKVKNAETFSMGDISTAYRSTGIPNIIVYVSMKKSISYMTRIMNFLSLVPGVTLLSKKMVDLLPPEPELVKRKGQSLIWGEVSNSSGSHIVGTMELDVDDYSFTVRSSLNAMKILLENVPHAGFYTPSMAFGNDFADQVENIILTFGNRVGIH